MKPSITVILFFLFLMLCLVAAFMLHTSLTDAYKLKSAPPATKTP